MGSSNGDRRRRRRRRMTWYDIPSVTDPQDHLLGKRILVVADELSLSSDADRCRLAIRFEALAHRLRSRTSSADLHLILSGERDEAYTSRTWAEEIGWQAHVKPWDMTPISHCRTHSELDWLGDFFVALAHTSLRDETHVFTSRDGIELDRKKVYSQFVKKVREPLADRFRLRTERWASATAPFTHSGTTTAPR